MYYSSEVRAIDDFRTDTTRIPDQELELATMLGHALAAPFELEERVTEWNVDGSRHDLAMATNSSDRRRCQRRTEGNDI